VTSVPRQTLLSLLRNLPPRADGDSFQADIFFVKDSGARKSPYLLLVDERNGMLIGRRLGSRSSRVIHPAMDTVLGYIESIMHKRPTVMYTDREAVLKDFQHYRGIQVL
jgi:hypothetical protein